jgi:hypothetical protein
MTLITKVPTTPDLGLPFYLPTLPHPLTHRWIADAVADDGEFIVPPVRGSVSLTGATGGATTLPTEGLVDGLRAITFDGTTDQAYALGVNPGPGGSITGYAVVKVTSDPAAARSIIHLGAQGMGFSSARKFSVGSAVLASAFTVGEWYVVGWSVKRNTGTGDAEWRVAASTGESAQVLSQNQSALATFVAFGAGFSGTKTAMAARDFGLVVGEAHSVAQLQANVAALAAEYGI